MNKDQIKTASDKDVRRLAKHLGVRCHQTGHINWVRHMVLVLMRDQNGLNGVEDRQ